MPLPSRSPIPLYFQISTELAEKIASGELKPGVQLASEKELARRFGVSLVTVRGALRVLLDKGLVVRYAGKGTFVAEPPAVRGEWAIGTLDDLIATGLKTSMKLLWRRAVYPPARVADALGLSARQKIVALRTIRHANGEPFMLTDTFHPSDIAARLQRSDFVGPGARNKLVISIVERKCSLTVGSARQTMSVESANQDDARWLEVEPGKPLLVVDREYFAAGGRLVQIGRTHYRTDHFRYVINLNSVVEAPTAANIYRLPSTDARRRRA